MLFDVYGQRLSVRRIDGQWQLFRESDTGLRSRVREVVIPPDLEAEAIARYLADLYHEHARPGHDEIRRLD
ncbi:hypothetical protein [Ferrimonas balearica]|uniref:DUF7661 family protein n=1 Tax=Ferrimonas balearica TaxID=44012 RepID=UPI001C995D54|nr:hypothetical protein [Ferrimonas balearica]MBY5994134.1 hypothetical protein [Ferrimonas balearica]